MALTSSVAPDASPHLRDLLGDAERLVERCAAAPATARRDLAATRRAEADLASLRLDGSPVEAVPDPTVIADARATAEVVAEAEPTRSGTWFDAMRSFDGPDPDDPEAAAHDAAVMALEFDGVARAAASDELGLALLRDPIPALEELHGLLTRDLVAPARIGQLRVSEQAVHDASVGRILYFTTDPGRIADELATFADRLVASGDEHAVIASGLVHLDLLRIHPFDAANGRLARAAARLVLRARGFDPEGLAAPEIALDEDRLGYHDEVARTLRRREPTVWLERWAEAVTAGLRRAARDLGVLGDDVPARAEAFVTGRPPGPFTVVDHRDEVGGLADAELRADRLALLDAGRIARVPGSRGLRFTIPA